MPLLNQFPRISEHFNFKCTMCGNCCTGDQKVHLNLYDLYKMARFKNFASTRQLLIKQIITLVKGQNNVFVPMIKFKRLISRKKSSDLPFTFCPFLLNSIEDDGQLKGYCQLHPRHKPLICSLAPVGRVVDLDKDSEEFVFVKPAPDCNGVESNEKVSLSATVNHYKTELDYEMRFFKILRSISERNLEKNEIIENIYSFNVEEPFPEILTRIENSL
ncbi:MAG: YkgJ family cysteine cluster protein [Calditrichaeota bacterium]|nr:YkgJ family cysteine cluster protein [Calditrichota bacterium]